MPTELRSAVDDGLYLVGDAKRVLKDTPIRGQAASHKASALVQGF